jgi:hypothetical protein
MPAAAFAACVRFVVWTIPSPSPGALGLRCCPSSVYTFPAEISVQAWLGIAISGFPEFGQFCIAGFPASTQVSLSPLRMPFRHARVAVRFAIAYDRRLREFTPPFPSSVVQHQNAWRIFASFFV